MSYETANLIINIFIAIGTCGAVIVALWLARPKKEKANGVASLKLYKSSPILEFWINNTGNNNIIFNNKAGFFFENKK